MVKKYTREADYSYTLGIAPTIELLRQQPGQVRELILNSKAATSEQVSRLLQMCRNHNIPTRFDDHALSRLTAQENTYVAGIFNKYACGLNADRNFVVLAQPSDTGNLGTIMRTMLAFDYTDLAIIEPGVDAWDPKVIRASMGAIFSINVHMFPTLADLMAKIPNPMYMFTGNGELELSELKPASPYSLVFGAEGAGLPAEYLQWGKSVKIRQSDKVDSLNLASAVSIALYQLSAAS